MTSINTNNSPVPPIQRKAIGADSHLNYCSTEKGLEVADEFFKSVIDGTEGSPEEKKLAMITRQAVAKCSTPELKLKAERICISAMASGIQGPVAAALATVGRNMFATISHDSIKDARSLAHDFGTAVNIELQTGKDDTEAARAGTYLAAKASDKYDGLNDGGAVWAWWAALEPFTGNTAPQGKASPGTIAKSGLDMLNKMDIDIETKNKMADIVLDVIEDQYKDKDPDAAHFARYARVVRVTPAGSETKLAVKKAAMEEMAKGIRTPAADALADFGLKAIDLGKDDSEKRVLARLFTEAVTEYSKYEAQGILAKAANFALKETLIPADAVLAGHEALKMLPTIEKGPIEPGLARFGMQIIDTVLRGRTDDDTQVGIDAVRLGAVAMKSLDNLSQNPAVTLYTQKTLDLCEGYMTKTKYIPNRKSQPLNIPAQPLPPSQVAKALKEAFQKIYELTEQRNWIKDSYEKMKSAEETKPATPPPSNQAAEPAGVDQENYVDIDGVTLTKRKKKFGGD